MHSLAEKVGSMHALRIDLDIERASQLGETTQVALYTIIRELLDQSIRRGPPSWIGVSLTPTSEGGVCACVTDDAEPERRRRSFEAIEERVHQLHGRITVAARETGGTQVVVTLPPYSVR